MAAPAPAPEADPAPAPPQPPLPPPLSDANYLRFKAVACSKCHCLLSACFNKGEPGVTVLACLDKTHGLPITRKNLAPKAFHVAEIESSPGDLTHAVLPIECPDKMNSKCVGKMCTLCKTKDNTNDMVEEYLVCHECKKYWRVV